MGSRVGKGLFFPRFVTGGVKSSKNCGAAMRKVLIYRKIREVGGFLRVCARARVGGEV